MSPAAGCAPRTPHDPARTGFGSSGEAAISNPSVGGFVDLTSDHQPAAEPTHTAQPGADGGGPLSAVQQIAAGIGSAAVTSVYFAGLVSGQLRAMSTSLLVVPVLCVVAVPLLPRKAAALEH